MDPLAQPCDARILKGEDGKYEAYKDGFSLDLEQALTTKLGNLPTNKILFEDAIMTTYTNSFENDIRTSESSSRNALDATSSRLYHIYHTAIRYDYRVCDADKNHVYHIYNSHFKPHKPALTFHEGEDSKGPVAGVCKFSHFSRGFKVGLGDPDHLGAMVWEDMQCQNFAETRYRWPMSVVSGDGGLERRWFVWKRTRSIGADGEEPAFFSARNFKLVDEMTGRVLAVFTSNSFKSVKKSGKLRVDVEFGREFDLMVLITVLAMYESIRRRRGSGGGGGD